MSCHEDGHFHGERFVLRASWLAVHWRAWTASLQARIDAGAQAAKAWRVMIHDRPRCLDAGEAALSVEFGDSVDPAINARVLALDAVLRDAALEGVLETVPTYRALMIHYEPLILSRAALIAADRSAGSVRHGRFRNRKRAGSCPVVTIPRSPKTLRRLAQALDLTPARRWRRCTRAPTTAPICMASRRAGAISAACPAGSTFRAAPARAGRRRKAPCSSAAACR